MEIIFIIFVISIMLILLGAAGIFKIFINDQKNFFNNTLDKILNESYKITAPVKKIKKKISFREKYKDVNLPVVSIKILNNEYDFILDTGANFNALDINQFKRIIKENDIDIDLSLLESNLQNNGSIIVGLGGEQSNVKDVNLQFNIEDIEFNEVFSLIDIGSALEAHGKKDHILCGVMGSEFFEKNKWKIDFEELVIWMNK